MTGRGIEVNSDAGSASNPIKVRGTSCVFSARGVQMNVVGSAVGKANFGIDGEPGRNAFTANSNRNFRVDLGASDVILARGNQWQNCYTGQADKNFCRTSSIANNDLNAPGVANVGNTSPDSCNPSSGCQPHQAAASSVPLAITEVYPTKGSGATLVHITGTGFDAISGNTGGNCRSLRITNKCSPLQGTCVEFLVDGITTGEPADILAVTPTHLVVRPPFDCTKPASIRINRLGANGNPLPDPPQIDFCKN